MCFDSDATEVVQVPESEPILAYRQYSIQDNRLSSIAYSQAAVERVTVAECLQQWSRHVEDAPQMGCTCGLHADAEPVDRRGRVAAQVKLWGRVVKHGDSGYRAEFMQPVRLAFLDVLPGCDCPLCSLARDEAAKAKLAEFYGAEWVDAVTEEATA